jgi:hypothetical protein
MFPKLIELLRLCVLMNFLFNNLSLKFQRDLFELVHNDSYIVDKVFFFLIYGDLSFELGFYGSLQISVHQREGAAGHLCFVSR